MSPWEIGLAIAIVLALVGDGNPIEGGVTLFNEITRGRRLTYASPGPDGVVNATPDDLATAAGASLEEYSLARMIASEEGNANTATKAAVALAMVNYARRAAKTITQILVRAKNAEHSGFYGTQRDIDQASSNFNHSDRYASTAKDPYAGDLEIARGVLDGSIEDFTGGAIQFDRAASETNPDKVASDRMSEGRTQVFPDGVDPGLRFWA
jgi:hypothetical protein